MYKGNKACSILFPEQPETASIQSFQNKNINHLRKSQFCDYLFEPNRDQNIILLVTQGIDV